jgi:NAD dependent epimerase/dehydratase
MIDYSYLRNKRILVTGAGGFIGSHLTECLLEKCAEVRAFVHYNSRNDWGLLEELPADAKSGINIISSDLRDYQAVRKATKQADIVFHLGALIGIPYSLSFPNDVVQTNVIGTLNILNASLENEVSKIIHTSTSEVYGTAQYVPINESHPLRPQSPYAASKIAADNIAESYYRSYNLPVSILRPFNTFGPRQSLRAIIPTIITQIYDYRRVIVGNVEPRRDFTFVADTVDGFVQLARKNGTEGQTFNLGVGKDISIKELIALIAKIIGVEPIIEIDEKRIRRNHTEVMQLLSDNSKSVKILEWQPKFSLKKGLEATIDWLKTKKQIFKTNYYNV